MTLTRQSQEVCHPQLILFHYEIDSTRVPVTSVKKLIVIPEPKCFFVDGLSLKKEDFVNWPAGPSLVINEIDQYKFSKRPTVASNVIIFHRAQKVKFFPPLFEKATPSRKDSGHEKNYFAATSL